MSAIFLSGTFDDLKGERKDILDLCQRLKVVIISQEIFGARPKDAVNVIQSEIRKSNCFLFLLIQGFRYGSLVTPSKIPIALKYGRRRVSFCEMEYDLACLLEIPRLIYVRKNKSGKTNFDLDIKQQRRREKFIKKLSKDNTIYYFSNRKDLTVQVAIDILKLIHNKQLNQKTEGPDYEDDTEY